MSDLFSYRPALLAQARCLVGAQEAEDIVQETFMSALARINNGLVPHDMGAWLRGILRNKVSEARRRWARWERPERLSPLRDQDMPEQMACALQSLGPCVQALRPHEAAALAAVYLEGQTDRQYAERSGLSLTVVQKRLSRGRLRLFKCMGPMKGEAA